MPKRILFIGDLNEYGRSFQRYSTFVDLGYDVVAHSHTLVSPPGTICEPSIAYRISWKARLPFDSMNTNRFIKKNIINENVFDIIWIEKGNMIHPHILKFIKKASPNSVLVSCSEDDMYARHGHSLYYRLGLKYYDFIFTTKTYNLEELKEFGGRNIRLFLDSFDEKTHRYVRLSEEEYNYYKADVSAIGAFESQRASSLLYLAQNGIRVSVWGNGWGNWVNRHPLLDVKNLFLFGNQYPSAISASKINLNFLRKSNRDQVTSRSVEIPACKSFMLAERTPRHLKFFEEGTEADFFGSNEELYQKVQFYLADDSVRKSVAERGYTRCISSGYSMREQLLEMLEALKLR